jgi:alpha-tubulin suppressor-like RCC1 family protein
MYLYIGQIKRIAAGMLHSACIDEKGTLFIFGQKTEKGFGRSGDELRPTVVEEVPFSEEVACGGYHTCVVTGIVFLFYAFVST